MTISWVMFWISDECHMLLSGHLNKQNMRLYGWQKPDECVQKPLHSEMVAVWCAISSHGIIGPYLLEDDDGSRCNVNSVVYMEQVIDRLRGDIDMFCQLNYMSLDDQWFQQDGAPCHIGRGNIEYISSSSSAFPYPQRSPDLTPPGSFVWGCIKENYFKPPVPTTLEQLKQSTLNM